MKSLKLSEHVKYIRETLRVLRSLLVSGIFKFIAVVLMIIFGGTLLFCPSLFTPIIFLAFCIVYIMFGFGCTLFFIDYLKEIIKSDFLVMVLHILIMLLWPIFLLFAYGLTVYHKLT